VTIPLAYTFPIGLVFWAAFAWAFYPEFRLLRKSGTKTIPGAQDRGSYNVIMYGQGIANFVSFAIATRSATAIQAHRAEWYWLGITLIIAGSSLRRHCFRTLGGQFTAAVRVRDEDAIVERGAYRWIRHPSYSAALLMFMGIGFALGNWASLVVVSGVSVIVYLYRIHVEEAALVGTHGDRYRAYVTRTRRLVPFLY
jgi:protein-S-isoprenylcysteine O-methyltransferase